MTKRIVNGKEIEYQDVIYHTTGTKFSFWERIKILFGKPVIVESEIYTANIPQVIDSEAKAYVPVLFPKKVKLVHYGEKP